MFPPWLKIERKRLFDQIGRDQLPHALLIHGPTGTGRRLLAMSIAGRLLDLDLSNDAAVNGPDALFGEESASIHPDLFIVQPPEDKRTIPVDGIRSLIEFLNLTSHQGGYKVVLINPANTMSANAANSLLKTLEEPPGNAAIVLVTNSLNRLTPTIVSRCQRVRIAIPAAEDALEWLRECNASVEWEPVLNMAGGAPITALEYQQAGVRAQVEKFEEDIDSLQRRQTTPTVVAHSRARKGQNIALYLSWLYQRLGSEIMASQPGAAMQSSLNPRNDSLQIGAENLNIVGAFDELQHIGKLRRLLGSGINMELQVSAILTRWYGQRTSR